MMAINYSVQADVTDIRSDTPKSSDAFLVDSNVWYWMAYSRASQSPRPPAQHQSTCYPAYTKAALAVGARLMRCGLSLAELCHLIEKTEREIYERAHGATAAKEYRHNLPMERSKAVSEVQAAWGLVKGLAQPLSVTIGEPTTDNALSRFQTQLADGYDLFILEAMAANGIAQIITDDGDFATIPSIQVFTANQTVIQAATAQGRLVVR